MQVFPPLSGVINEARINLAIYYFQQGTGFRLWQWFLTWGEFTPGENFIFQGGKFTEP